MKHEPGSFRNIFDVQDVKGRELTNQTGHSASLDEKERRTLTGRWLFLSERLYPCTRLLQQRSRYNVASLLSLSLFVSRFSLTLNPRTFSCCLPHTRRLRAGASRLFRDRGPGHAGGKAMMRSFASLALLAGWATAHPQCLIGDL